MDQQHCSRYHSKLCTGSFHGTSESRVDQEQTVKERLAKDGTHVGRSERSSSCQPVVRVWHNTHTRIEAEWRWQWNCCYFVYTMSQSKWDVENVFIVKDCDNFEMSLIVIRRKSLVKDSSMWQWQQRVKLGVASAAQLSHVSSGYQNYIHQALLGSLFGYYLVSE